MSGDAFHVTAPPENGEGARKAMAKALRDAALNPGSDAIRQRACDLDGTRRSRGDHGHPPRLRRRRGQTGGQFHQVDDRPFARRGRRRGGDIFGAGAARSGRTADHQSAHSRARAAISITFPSRAPMRSNTRCPIRLGSVAPTVRSFSADFEPLRLVARFPEHYPGLLESGAVAAPNAAGGRFDILPMASGEVLEMGQAQRLRGAHAAAGGGFLDALERWWAELRVPQGPQELPFQGGWLVYLGYEIAAEIEPTLHLAPNPDPLVALAIRTPAAWIRDRQGGQAWLICEPGSEALLERFTQHAAAVQAQGEWHSGVAAVAMSEDPPAQFLTAVRAALEYIAAGDVYQANLSRQWVGRGEAQLDPVGVYLRLRATNPSPFAGLLRLGDFAVLSSSPERLVSVRGDRISTRPIAGTRPRGATAQADAALIRTLLESEKERAEHVMLIDLERNDLGRVCAGGSVQVDEYMTVETYAHVHHIVSNVSGRCARRCEPGAGDPRDVSRRYDHRLSEGALHADHRGAGAGRTRRLHRFPRVP
jgi:anthranilate synthase component I